MLDKHNLPPTPEGLVTLVNVHMQSITLSIKFNAPTIPDRPVNQPDENPDL
jgi:hypothetical protein